MTIDRFATSELEYQVLLDEILVAIPKLLEQHSHASSIYAVMSFAAKHAANMLFGEQGPQRANIGLAGEVVMPYTRMGAINSTHLFGLDELILFSYYASRAGHYQRVADLGANIGLHSILLAKLGYQVDCFEPDPLHIIRLRENLRINRLVDRLTVHGVAVSDRAGSVEFCRVLGNTTSSHISGAKAAPYGELETLTVDTVDIRAVMKNVDFLKIDVEGHEANLIEATGVDDWNGREAVVEIGSAENAARIFTHLRAIGVNIFSQKIGWRRVANCDQLPTSYREGSVFISTAATMVWG